MIMILIIKRGGNELVFYDDPNIGHLFIKLEVLENQYLIQRDKHSIKESNHLLLNLLNLLKKVWVQLQPQQKETKRIFKLKLKINCMIVLIIILKNYLILT